MQQRAGSAWWQLHPAMPVALLTLSSPGGDTAGSATCAQFTECKESFRLSRFPQCFCWPRAHTGEGIFSISFTEAKLFESFEITHRLGLVIANVELATNRKEKCICFKHKMLLMRFHVLNLFQMFQLVSLLLPFSVMSLLLNQFKSHLIHCIAWPVLSQACTAGIVISCAFV